MSEWRERKTEMLIKMVCIRPKKPWKYSCKTSKITRTDNTNVKFKYLCIIFESARFGLLFLSSSYLLHCTAISVWCTKMHVFKMRLSDNAAGCCSVCLCNLFVAFGSMVKVERRTTKDNKCIKNNDQRWTNMRILFWLERLIIYRPLVVYKILHTMWCQRLSATATTISHKFKQLK